MWAGTRLSPGFVLVHGPRDEDELATVLGIVVASHAHASGAAVPPPGGLSRDPAPARPLRQE